MLDAKELKVVMATLTKRRAWLLKSLEDKTIEDEAREENLSTLKLLDSSMQKLAKLASNSPKPSKPPASAPQASPPTQAKKGKRKSVDPQDAYVLIAEDNHDSALLLQGVLEDMGITKVDIVEDGRAAVYALQNCSPPFDIVLCDWDMPEMNGLEVRKAVKSLAKLQDTHFVMVTAVSEAARIKEAIMNGVNDYIVKPVDVDVLEKKLLAALAGGDNGNNKKDEVQAVKTSG